MKRVRPVREAPSIEATIFSYINRLASERDIDRLILLLADFGRDLVGADRCTIWLCDEKEGTLWSRVAGGVDRIVIPKTTGITGWVATHGEPLLINDPYHDHRFDQDIDKRTGYRTRAVLALPIDDADGRTVGVIQAVNKKTADGTFSEADREHLQLAAAYLAEVLKAAQLHAEIEAAQRAIVLTMVEAVRLRSTDWGAHSRQVGAICRLLGELVGMSTEEVETLALVAPLHDIGLIAIPDSVLLKPTALDDAEWKVMRTHTTLGHDMLKHSERSLLGEAAIVAWQHHERWDGSGYPCGLAGENIHRSARIAAIADVFDALASDRPWRKAWSAEKIAGHVEAEAGRHFDPDLARVFLDNYNRFTELRASTPEDAAPQSHPGC